MADLSHGANPRRRAIERALNKTRLVTSFGHALTGLRYAWTHEPNFRIECFVGSAAVVLALVLGVSPVPVLLCCALVLSLELVNSALEAAIDLVTKDLHPLAKLAKDAAAAAVLLASLLAALVGVWVLGPPLWRVLQHSLSALL